MDKSMLERWAEAYDKVLIINDFLEWCLRNGKDPINDMTPMQDLMYEYFKIDAAQLEKERRALYEEQR